MLFKQALQIFFRRCLIVDIDAEKLKADGFILLLQYLVLIGAEIQGETDFLYVRCQVLAHNQQDLIVLQVLDSQQSTDFLIGKQVGISIVYKHEGILSKVGQVCKPQSHLNPQLCDLLHIMTNKFHITVFTERKYAEIG